VITYHGNIVIPNGLIEAADQIKYQNYKVTKIGKIAKQTPEGVDAEYVMRVLGSKVERDHATFNAVYFSACSGAEEHVDMLDQEEFEDTTYVIPLILPQGDSIIRAGKCRAIVEVGGIYEFDHTKPHEMTVEDDKSGCVVLMVAVKK
jgi:hypothetical protein